MAGSPLISYSLRWLRAGGIDNATICTSSRRVQRHVGDGSSLTMGITYYEDLTPRGAAGCVRDAAIEREAQTLVVVDGTAIPAVDLDQLLAAHVLSGAAMSVVGHRDPGTNTQGYRPLTPAGIYVLDRRVLDFIPEKGFQDIKETLIPRLHQAGERVLSYAGRGACPRIINPETYLAVNHWMIEEIASRSAGAAEGRGRHGVIHPDAKVDSRATIVGPVLVGPGAIIERDTSLVGPSIIGAQSRVARGALVSRSVVWSRCDVGEDAVVDRCLLGDDTQVVAGSNLVSMLKVEVGSERAAAQAVSSGDWLSAFLQDAGRTVRTPGFAIAFPGRMGVA